MNPDVAAALALTLGHPVTTRFYSWPSVFGIARRERCAPLAWLRSADTIRSAPAEVVSAWRTEALASVSLSRFWDSLMQRALRALQSAGVSPVVLKGLPLAQRLYGDPSARPCADLDLYVAAPERSAAHRALTAAGWRWRAGDLSREASYVSTDDGRTALLEVHSALLDDGLVAHLPFAAPGVSLVPLGTHTVPTHDDDQLAAFLATHLAKHAMPPLLWMVDFRELWTSLDDGARSRAWTAARAARAHRYLYWAIRRADALGTAASGDAAALRRLGFKGTHRVDLHNAVRIAALAGTPADAWRTAASWVMPEDACGTWVGFGRLVMRRVPKLARHRGVSRRAYEHAPSDHSRTSPVRSIEVGSEDLDALVTALGERDVSVCISARGTSMWPSIVPGTSVRLRPAGRRPIRVDDVVLARLPSGGHVLHRVQRVSGDSFRLQGDGNVTADPMLPRDAILAVADAVLLDGRFKPVPFALSTRARRWLRRAVAAASPSRQRCKHPLPHGAKHGA